MANPKGNEATLKKFQPKWHSGETRTIRVPIAIADQILEYAHNLDEAVTQENRAKENFAIANQQSNVIETLTQVIHILEIISIAERFTKRLRQRLKEEAITPLKTLTQENEEPRPILEAIAKLEKQEPLEPVDTRE